MCGTRFISDSDISSDGTRVAMTQYSSSPQTEFSFVDDPATLESNFNNVVYMGGSTFTATAIQYTYDNIIFGDARPGVRTVMVVVTDGASGDNVEPVSDDMRANGVVMFAVGYAGASETELNEIANDPDEDHVFIGNTADDLLDLRIKLTETICTSSIA